MPDATVWEDIHHAYVNTTTPVREILQTYNITRYDFDVHRKRHNWPTRPSPIKPKLPSSAATKKPSDTSAAPKPPTKPAPSPPPKSRTKKHNVITRLTAAIDNRLNLLERRMAREASIADDDTAPTSADIERDIRAIGGLMKNLEQATENDGKGTTKAGRTGKSAARARADTAATADAADRYRRELGDRLQRLVEAAGKDP